ncbi:MAG: hypothetical protein QOH82_3731 [Mycobacterium sp.]|nr:hypothetical protein [Mycobacterium sp.]
MVIASWAVHLPSVKQATGVSTSLLGIGLLVDRFGSGRIGVIAGVGMNAAAVDVERDYERPIMASFHAVFSIGNVLGALIGAAGFELGIGVIATAVAVTVAPTARATTLGRCPNKRNWALAA